ncbi:penicillin-binding protein 1A [Hydrogenispora ethanolica]|jgi:penicillin-binding protein 1A|uniref:Penicillin-binding protein 1A n=1 Tax=Hydrogenispora ethanolica TaxID=1082276 RepID=A0A4R1REA5_HYDET|nr:PBP1A family penicillin-binding protein [Hydrogenispora ethanolica]TCL64244.1 penicillin-binding protein 1A [Hydrogenispora ethanolica]
MPVSKKKSPPRSQAKRLDTKKTMVIGFTALAGILLGLLLVLMISTNSNLLNLPPPKQATIFYDVNKKEFTRIYVENRLEVPLSRIPDVMKQAIVDVEDNRFYEHSGIDLRAIARALWVDLKGGGYIEGASTITQQLARNVLLTQKKALSRKVQEVFLAMNIERSYTKDEILERYLNQIYFGHNTYGVEAASRLYFGKSVSELRLHQAAMLAGLPKNPSGFSPYLHPEAAMERRAVVLGQMLKYGSISQSDFDAANRRPLDVIPLSAAKRRAAYFIDYVVQNLKGVVDEQALFTGGYKIYTTLDPLAQQAADEAVAALNGGKPDAHGVLQPQMALVAIDPHNGYIKAMVGGRDFGNTQLNRAVYAHRQPGSAIKPFTYVAAIDSRKYTPSSIVRDEPLSYPTSGGVWAPHNYDNIFRGDITLRHALEESVNMVAIKLVENLGPSTVIKYAQDMGLKNLVINGEPNDMNLSSLALGGLTRGVTPLELTASYSPLANQGIYVQPIAILEVRDANDNILYQDRPHKKIAIPEDTAFLVTDMMRGVIMRGTGRAALIDRPAAGKTGTTSDYTNAWFVGFTPDLLASVWIGNDSQKIPVRINGNVIGSGKAAQIWGIFMRKALSETPPSDFIPPAGIVSGVEICAQSGELATSNCPETLYESYLDGTQPTVPCHLHSDGQPPLDNNNPAGDGSGTPPVDNNGFQQQRSANWPFAKKKQVAVKICTESGLLATPYCPSDWVVTEIFTDGEQPTSYCNIHRR